MRTIESEEIKADWVNSKQNINSIAMVNKIIYLLAIIFFTIISCKKDNVGNFSKKSCRPKSVKFVLPSDTTQNSLSEYFYKNDTLIKIDVNKGSFIIEYKYNGAGQLESMFRAYGGEVKELDTFEYNSDSQLIRHAMFAGSINGRLHAEVSYEYEDNKLTGSHIGIYKTTGDTILLDERYFYDATGNIVRIAQPSEVVSGEGSVLEYDNHEHWLKNVGVPIRVRSYGYIDITERQLSSTIHNNMLKQIIRTLHPNGEFHDFVQHSRTLTYNKYNYPIRIQGFYDQELWYEEIEYTGCN